MMVEEPTQDRKSLQEYGRTWTLTDLGPLCDRIYHGPAIDMADTFHHFFFYEACPLLKMAQYLNDPDVRIQFCGPHARYDALLLLGPDQVEQRVEVTAAMDFENDALRMELLGKRLFVPGFGAIDAKGTKGNRKFGEKSDIAFESDDLHKQNIYRINQVPKRNLEMIKQYKIH